MTQKNLVTQKPVIEKADEEKDEENENEGEENKNEDEVNENEDEETPLKKQFWTFVTLKDQSNPGTHILLSQSDFWMKHAGVLAGKKITTTDTGVCFFKFKKYKLSYTEYLEFLHNLADYKNVSVDEMIEKMVNCEPPDTEINKIQKTLIK